MESLGHIPENDRSQQPEIFETGENSLFNFAINKRNARILGRYGEEQQTIIKQKLWILSSLANFIGKDFNMQVELNKPKGGWHWDFKNNIVRIDPQDLLEKSEDYLRFVIAHEGGHRRISRASFIPLEEWKQPGFAFMMNSIEDPRDNNFLVDNYPSFGESMKACYQNDKGQKLDFEKHSKEKAAKKLGFQPRHMLAGFEFIKLWFKERQGEKMELSEDLPDDVRMVVLNTIEAAQDSWWRYPSRQEADESEEIIKEYARVSYSINRDRIWPEFKKLVDADLKDQMVREYLKQKQKEESENNEIPDSDPDKPEIKPDEPNDTNPEPDEPEPIEPEKIEEIKEIIDSLPESEKTEIADRARKTLKEFEDAINEELAGKLSDNPERLPEKKPSGGMDEKERAKYRERLENEIKKDATVYEKNRLEVMPLINNLETRLRDVLSSRQRKKWQTGYATGKRLDIGHRMQEKAKSVPLMESRAWQKREGPEGKNVSITLLIDLSGSMRGKKIEETFKAVIVLAEVLNRLSINVEILGFNDRIYEYQKFNQRITKEAREKMGGMLNEVNEHKDGTGAYHKAAYNDDGWALLQAAERLELQKTAQNILLAISDGQPAESPAHPGDEYPLEKIIENIIKKTNINLIGMGLGRGTDHVRKYYPTSIANIDVEEMAQKLADLIEQVLVN